MPCSLVARCQLRGHFPFKRWLVGAGRPLRALPLPQGSAGGFTFTAPVGGGLECDERAGTAFHLAWGEALLFHLIEHACADIVRFAKLRNAQCKARCRTRC